MSSYQYRKSHCGDKTVVRSSYLHNGISYTGKMSSLYWIGALVFCECSSQEKCNKWMRFTSNGNSPTLMPNLHTEYIGLVQPQSISSEASPNCCRTSAHQCQLATMDWPALGQYHVECNLEEWNYNLGSYISEISSSKDRWHLNSTTVWAYCSNEFVLAIGISWKYDLL